MPVTAMGIGGKKLTATHARAAWGASGASLTEDTGPDNAAGKDFEVVPCAQDAVPTQPVPTAAPDPAAATPAAAPAPAPPAEPKLDVKVIAGNVSARRANRTGRLHVKLSAPSLLYAVSAQLRRGGKRLARGWLDELQGQRRMRLRVLKALKPGTYELALRASEPTGETRTGSVLIRVKR